MNKYLNRLDKELLLAILEEEFELSKLLQLSTDLKIDISSKQTLISLIDTIISEKMITNQKYLIALCSKMTEIEIREISSLTFDEEFTKHSYLKALNTKKISNKAVKKLLNYFDLSNSENLGGYEVEDYINGPQNRFYELLDYQFIIKEQILSVLKEKPTLPRMIIHMPTGTGKTKTTVHAIIHNYIFNHNKKGCMLWLAHTNELLLQAYNAFRTTWTAIGKGDIEVKFNDLNELDKNNSIYFISYQKLISTYKRKNEIFTYLRKYTVSIVADEAHKCLARETRITIENMMKLYWGENNKVLLGLTATPGRKLSYFDDSDENQLLSEMFEKRIISVNPSVIESIKLRNNFIVSDEYNEIDNQDKETIRYFQKNKILSKIKRKELSYNQSDSKTKATLSKVKKSKNNDYNYQFLDEVSNLTERNIVIIEELLSLNSANVPVILFSCSVKHGKFIESVMKLFGIDARGVYGETDKIKRHNIIKDFDEGKFNILINFEVLATGFDSPRIESVFITRPTNSIVLYSQMLGRGLRGSMMGGNDSCLLIDLKDNLDKFSNEEQAFNYFTEYWRS